MLGFDGWDWAILAVAGYVAVLSLVRLMRTHHDVVMRQWQEGIRQEGARRSRRRGADASREKPHDSADGGQGSEAA